MIRKYHKSDLEEVKRIFKESIIHGRTIEDLLGDSDFGFEIFIFPYLLYEPESGIVSENNGFLNGYLVSSTSPSSLRKIRYYQAKRVIKKIFGLLNINNGIDERTRKFLRWAITRGLIEKQKTPPNVYSHLHLAVDRSKAEFFKTAQELINEFEKMLTSRGIYSYYGEVISGEKRRTERVYRNLGFEIFDKRKNTLYGDNFFSLCILKRLTHDPYNIH